MTKAKRATPRPQKTPRYTREDWLRAALDALARKGQAGLRLDILAARLGVTKGSFYHHFRNRADFHSAITDYWSRAYTDSVIAFIRALDAPAEARLIELTRRIYLDRPDRFDTVFRSWAARDTAIAAQVRKVDEKRHAFATSLFAAMGFEGDDLAARVKFWLICASAGRTVHIPGSAPDAETAIMEWHRFFTR